MSKLSTKRILKEIGCDKLQLYRSPKGYFYFVYDDPFNEIFETDTVMCFRLDDCSFKSWVEAGKQMVARVQKMIEGRSK